MVMNHLPGTCDDPPSIWSSPNLNPEKKICQSNSHLCLSTKLTSAGQNSQLEGGPKQPNQTTLGLNIWPNGIRFHQPSGFPEIRRFPLQSPPFGRKIIGPEICCLLKWLFRNRLRLRGAFFTGTRPYNGRVRALSSLNWRWIWDFGRAYRYAYIYIWWWKFLLYHSFTYHEWWIYDAKTIDESNGISQSWNMGHERFQACRRVIKTKIGQK